MSTTTNPVFAVSRLAVAVIMALTGFRAVNAQNAPEEVVVTGTRIQTSGMTTPTPVTTVSAGELQAMSPSTLVEGVVQLPQFYGSTTTANTAGFFTTPGAGNLNLRGLSTKRTLTLLDGRRVVSSTIYGGPDINLFPENMLSRVEAVTGGASAAYGTDAVSGVVNFILDTEFDGFRANVQTGQTAEGDDTSHEISVSGGFSIGERTHMLISGEVHEQDGVHTYADRDWYQSWGRVRNDAPGNGTSLDNPQEFILPNVVSTNASYDGVIIFPAPSGLPRMIFNPDGSYSPFTFGSVSSLTSGSHSITNGGSGTDNSSDRPNVQNETSRENLFVYVDHDVGDNINVYGQLMYGAAEFTSLGAGGSFHGANGQPMTIFQNNAFLPDSLRQLMIDNNVASFTFGRIGHSSDMGGDNYLKQDTEVASFTVGFDANLSTDGFFDGWRVEGYAQYGETQVIAEQHGGSRIDRIYHAVDAVVDPATGNIVCNATLVSGSFPDCVPINLFGRGNASAAAIDWVTSFDPGIPVTTVPYLPGYPPETYSYISVPAKERDITIEQLVFEFSASGEVADGWAGPITMAFGAAWRKESLDQLVRAAQGNPAADPFVFPVATNNAALGIRGVPAGAWNNSVETQFSKVPFARGEFDVAEVFTEILVPLVDDRLSLNGAVRRADYEGSGGFTSYKLGLDVFATESIRLRGTHSHDVRAATLGERFDRTGAAGNITDRAVTPPPAPYPVTLVQGGNPTVKPEEADTTTVGIVYRPRALEGLDFSVDWYETKLQGAIEAFTPQQIVDLCYQFNDQEQCQYIERNPTTDEIQFINQTFQNVSQADVSGVDLELVYRRDVAALSGGQLTLRYLASFLNENSTTGATGVRIDRAGETGGAPPGLASLPEWKHTLSAGFARGPLSLYLQGRYIDSGLLSATNNVVSAATGTVVYNVADNTVDSAFYVDGRVAWTFDTPSGSIEVYGNISNLLDEDPPIAAAWGAFGANSAQSNSALFDLLGRRYVIGVRFSL
jgi:outer membrane receptor protein involved in Fe transport